ncbi:MAG TPA: class II glutamine amidotransferase, partial [Cellvibrio sp.]
MCQLLGMSCKKPASIGFSFEGFRARGGRTDEHRDGWGIAFSNPNGFDIYRDEQPAAGSHLADHISKAEIKAKTTIAHIRKATIGEVNINNCHPFERKLWNKSWLFCHNGDLKNFSPVLDSRYVPEGNTDSELAFCKLLQDLNRDFPDGEPTLEILFDWLHCASVVIATQGTFNIILSNGEWLYTFCSTHLAYVERQYPFQEIEFIDTE